AWSENDDVTAPGARGEEAAPAFESLLLELQRSLDYVESEFGRSPIRRIVVGPAENELSAIGPYLEQNLRLQVEFLDLTRLFPGEASPNAAEQAQALAAAGGALGPGNLFTEELAPKQEAYAGPNLRSLAQMSLAVAVFGLFQFGMDQLQAQSLRGELALLGTQQEATQVRLKDLTSQIARAEADPAQQARVSALDSQRRAQATLLQQLEGDGGPGRPFAGLLAALAERPVEGLWLTRIRLRDEGRALTLEGSALGPELMPLLLARLKAEPAFDGMSFESVRIERPEDGPGHIEFTLETAPPDESGTLEALQ
ncbi:MAG: PilN domain-containing protein, partial [bacterium]|nr:PilN domain-containing protein [bacterium]